MVAVNWRGSEERPKLDAAKSSSLLTEALKEGASHVSANCFTVCWAHRTSVNGSVSKLTLPISLSLTTLCYHRREPAEAFKRGFVAKGKENFTGHAVLHTESMEHARSGE